MSHDFTNEEVSALAWPLVFFRSACAVFSGWVLFLTVKGVRIHQQKRQQRNVMRNRKPNPAASSNDNNNRNNDTHTGLSIHQKKKAGSIFLSSPTKPGLMIRHSGSNISNSNSNGTVDFLLTQRLSSDQDGFGLINGSTSRTCGYYCHFSYCCGCWWWWWSSIVEMQSTMMCTVICNGLFALSQICGAFVMTGLVIELSDRKPGDKYRLKTTNHNIYLAVPGFATPISALLGFDLLLYICFRRLDITFKSTRFRISESMRTRINYLFAFIGLSQITISVVLLTQNRREWHRRFKSPVLITTMVLFVMMISMYCGIGIWCVRHFFWNNWSIVKNMNSQYSTNLLANSKEDGTPHTTSRMTRKEKLLNTALRVSLCTTLPLVTSLINGILWFFTMFYFEISFVLNYYAMLDISFNCFCLLCTMSEYQRLYDKVFGTLHRKILDQLHFECKKRMLQRPHSVL